MKYRISQTTNSGDDRLGTTPDITDLEGLKLNVQLHIKDVIGLFHYFMRKDVFPDVKTHDYTKIDDFNGFVDNIREAVKYKKPFKGHPWWKNHIKKERHHAFLYTGEHDIHLGDIIHMLCDWVAAGKARSADGKFQLKRLEVSAAHDKENVKRMLYEAYLNTLVWLDENSEVDTRLTEGEK